MARAGEGELYQIELTSDLDSVPRAGAWLAEVASRLELEDELTQRLDLALAEALTNVVSYAHGAGPGQGVTVRLARDGTGARLELVDNGRPFDPLAREPVPLARSLEEATVGGFGLRLLRAAMDECRYRRAKGQNVLTLIARPRRPVDAPPA